MCSCYSPTINAGMMKFLSLAVHRVQMKKSSSVNAFVTSDFEDSSGQQLSSIAVDGNRTYPSRSKRTINRSEYNNYGVPNKHKQTDELEVRRMLLQMLSHLSLTSLIRICLTLIIIMIEVPHIVKTH